MAPFTATLCARFRPDQAQLHEPVHAAKAALRSLARRVIDLEAEIDMLDSQLKPLLARAAPRTTSLLAVSTDHAGTLLAAAGQNVDRLAVKHRSPRHAAQARSPSPPDAPTVTASTTAVTATPTAPCT